MFTKKWNSFWALSNIFGKVVTLLFESRVTMWTSLLNAKKSSLNSDASTTYPFIRFSIHASGLKGNESKFKFRGTAFSGIFIHYYGYPLRNIL